MTKPSVGRIVHYRSYGTPGGEYTSQCRAAVIAGVPEGALPYADAEHAEQWDSSAIVCDLVVFNPTGLFFNRCPYERPDGEPRGGTWHWPERVEDQPAGVVEQVTQLAQQIHASRDQIRAVRTAVDGMRITTDPTDPRLTHGPDPADGPPREQADTYLVLSEAERAKGFVRPVRRSYWHTSCGQVTTMDAAIAETYARDPQFYGGTYCVQCGLHRPVGPGGEFYWCDPGSPETQDRTRQPKVGT